MKGQIYIAGPMRGLPLFNFPAFDKAAGDFRERGWTVINPAQMDRDRGFHETMPEPTAEFLRDAILRDLQAIGTCSALAVLPGWQESKGALAEVALARFLELEIYCAVSGRRLEGD
jgi:hypothetical protein